MAYFDRHKLSQNMCKYYSLRHSEQALKLNILKPSTCFHTDTSSCFTCCRTIGDVSKYCVLKDYLYVSYIICYLSKFRVSQHRGWKDHLGISAERSAVGCLDVVFWYLEARSSTVLKHKSDVCVALLTIGHKLTFIIIIIITVWKTVLWYYYNK